MTMDSISPYALELHREHVARQARFWAASLIGKERAVAARLKLELAEQARCKREKELEDAKKRERELAEQARRDRELSHTVVPESAIDHELVRETVRRHIHISDAIDAVAKHYDVMQIDMYARRRPANIVRPRQIAMYVARAITTFSLPQIARRFDYRDHTTVFHGIRKIEALKASDPELSSEIDALIAELKALAWRRAANSPGPGGDHVRAAIAAGWGA